MPLTDTAEPCTASIRPDLSRPLYGATAAIASGLVVSIVTEYAFDNTLGAVWRPLVIGGSLGLAVTAAGYVAARRLPGRVAVGRTMLACWAVVAVLAIVNLLTQAVPLMKYGDRLAMIAIVEDGYDFPRWLMGVALLQWFRAAVWDAIAAGKTVEQRYESIELYVNLMGTLVMCAATLAFLWKRPGRLAVVFPTTAPIWLLLATGYTEYYPFMAWFLLGLWIYLFEEDIDPADRHPYVIGAIMATLPVVYIGLAPVSIILCLYCVWRRPREAVRIFAASAVAVIVLLRIFWPKDIDQYFIELRAHMIFPPEVTFDAYIGQGLSENSNFFTLGYAFSSEHLLHVLYMYLYGGGYVFPLMLTALIFMGARGKNGAAARPHRTLSSLRAAIRRRPRVLLAAAMVFWHAWYMLFYIPRLGPYGDIDLFSATFITIAFFAGQVADGLIDRGRMPESVAPGLLALAVGSTSIAAVYLLFVGMPIEP